MGAAKVLAIVTLCLLSAVRDAVAETTYLPVSDELIFKAHQRWLAATCRNPKYAVVRFIPAPMHCFGTGREYWGCFIRDTGEILISSDLRNWSKRERLEQTVLHEMGHSLKSVGGHVPKYSGVMTEIADESMFKITQTDIALVCKEESCPCQHPE